MLEKLRESKNQTITPLYRISDNSGTLNNRWTLKAVQLYSINHLTTMVSKDLDIIAINMLMATIAIRTWYKPKSATPVCRVISNSGLSVANIAKSVKPNSDQNKLSRLLSKLQKRMFGKLWHIHCTVSQLHYYTFTYWPLAWLQCAWIFKWRSKQWIDWPTDRQTQMDRQAHSQTDNL